MNRMQKVVCVAVAAMALCIGAAGGASASDGAKAVPGGTNGSAARLKNYGVIASSSITVGAGAQAFGNALCPTNQVPLGGGVIVNSSDLNANVNDSFPMSNGWGAHVNNASSSQTAFTVYAVCAKAPKNYSVVTAAGTSAAGVQQSFSATCTAGQVTGGGLVNNSSSLSVNLNSSFPASKTTWRTDLNNGSAAAASVTAFTICADGIPSRTTVVGAAVATPTGAETSVSVLCPSGLVATGGGVVSSSASVAVNINSSGPFSDGSGWITYVNNTSGSSATATPYVRCGSM